MEFTLRGLINGPRVGYLQHEDKTKRTETYGASFTPPSAGIPNTGYTQKDVSSSPSAVCFSSPMNVIEYYPCTKLFFITILKTPSKNKLSGFLITHYLITNIYRFLYLIKPYMLSAHSHSSKEILFCMPFVSINHAYFSVVFFE